MTALSGWVFDNLFVFEAYPSPPLPVPTPVYVPEPTVTGYVESRYFRVETVSVESIPTKSFWDRDFKNSLFLSPSLIDLGFLAGESEHAVELWSTFEKPLSLSRLVGLNTSGLMLSGPEEEAVLPAFGGHFDYVLRVSNAVDVKIDAHWYWEFDAASTELSVLGTKLVPWPYRPVYPVEEQWQWKTAVIETRTQEQRLANAESPLQSLTYHYRHLTAKAVDNDARFAVQGRYPFAVPLWLEGINNVSVAEGKFEIVADIGERPFGEIAMLYHGPYDFEMVDISDVHPDRLVLKRPTLYHHDNAVLLPIRFCLSEQGLQSTRRGRAAEQHITFSHTAPLIPPTNDWPLMYLGRPVLFNRGRAEGIADDVAFNWKSKTTSTGNAVHVLNQDFSRHRTECELLERDRAHLQGCLSPLKGQLNTLWWVSFHQEIQIADKCSRGRIVVSRRGFNDYFPSGVHLYLAWRSGRQLTKAIPAGFDEHGNEVLEIEGDLSEAVLPDDLIGGHLMRLMRPAEDEWQFQHNAKTSAIRLPLVEVPNNEIRELEHGG
ncbi:hypothetical protein [Thaumasiovibrio subtropicus]|uniref:hypothetical protein n=1 Tax=Thaumasiovibrio subtropicus TaxID=1891207 RepID=UPI000B35B6A8|nr:hypothetical protein [Thaumasiovibrio subtropicus]